MSTRSSFREAIERRAAIPDEPPKSSDSRAALLLKRREGLSRPVATARDLTRHGLSLRKAHQAIDRLAADHSVAVEVDAADVAGLIRSLGVLGVDAAILRRPDVDAKQVREVLGLSQSDFARRFGLEVRTVQNWEQNRYGLDAPARILLALIRDAPSTVESVLTKACSKT